MMHSFAKTKAQTLQSKRICTAVFAGAAPEAEVPRAAGLLLAGTQLCPDGGCRAGRGGGFTGLAALQVSATGAACS